MKIAIVGAGISGLVTGYLLGQRHDVRVFEANDYTGGHTNTVEVEVDGTTQRVDTGFIVYNVRTYPNFCRLLDRIGVETQASDMSFSVACERSGVEYATHSMRALFARSRSIIDAGFYRMLGEILRFNRQALELIDGRPGATLADLLKRGGFSRRFADHYIVPMGAAIWSADPERLLEFPASRFVRFFENHGLLDHRRSVPWRVVRGGSSRYVEALTRTFEDRIHTRCPVLSVRRHGDGVELLLPDGVRMRFDHVVLACHSDQALALLEDRSPAERSLLGAIRYQPNDVVLHTDAAIMPARETAWASWNYRIARDRIGGAIVTYHMNRLQGLTSSRPLFVSLNAQDRIHPARVLRRFTYHHPVYTAAAIQAQSQRAEIDGDGRTHFCGAYWGNGFHEDGVNSALEVCRRFGEEL